MNMCNMCNSSLHPLQVCDVPRPWTCASSWTPCWRWDAPGPAPEPSPRQPWIALSRAREPGTCSSPGHVMENNLICVICCQYVYPRQPSTALSCVREPGTCSSPGDVMRHSFTGVVVSNLRKRDFLRKHSLHGEKSSLGFIKAIHQW